MICSGELATWAGMLLEDTGDEVTPTGSVVSWLRNNLYKLNLSINTQYGLNESGCIEPDMDQVSSGLYSEMYICNWLKKKSHLALNGFQYDWSRIGGDEQGSITKVTKNDASKNYSNLANDCSANLNKLIQWVLGVYVAQVAYSDRCSTTDATLLPPPNCYSSYNRFFRGGCC